MNKQCTQCNEVKPLNCFAKRKDNGSYRGRCLACSSKNRKEKYAANPKFFIARNLASRKKNPEAFNRYRRKYYKLHPEKVAEWCLRSHLKRMSEFPDEPTRFLSLSTHYLFPSGKAHLGNKHDAPAPELSPLDALIAKEQELGIDDGDTI